MAKARYQFRCARCGGNAYLDKALVQGTRFDIACIHCGQRKIVNAKTSKNAAIIFNYYKLNELTPVGGDLHRKYLAKVASIKSLNDRLRRHRLATGDGS